MTAETPQDAYNRGVVDTRLDHHDEQISAINVLLTRTIDISQTQASIVQTLTEARVTDAATRLATAQAVKDAKDQQEAQAITEARVTDKSWSPAAKLIATIGTVVTVVAVLWAILSSLPTL